MLKEITLLLSLAVLVVSVLVLLKVNKKSSSGKKITMDVVFGCEGLGSNLDGIDTTPEDCTSQCNTGTGFSDCCEMMCDKDPSTGAYVNCDPAFSGHDPSAVCRNP